MDAFEPPVETLMNQSMRTKLFSPPLNAIKLCPVNSFDLSSLLLQCTSPFYQATHSTPNPLNTQPTQHPTHPTPNPLNTQPTQHPTHPTPNPPNTQPTQQSIQPFKTPLNTFKLLSATFQNFQIKRHTNISRQGRSIGHLFENILAMDCEAFVTSVDVL